MSLVLLTAPTAEPIHRTEVKLHLRQDDTADDAIIDAAARAAREKVESDTRRQLVTATWQLRLDEFPSDDERENPFGSIELTICPVVSVTSVKYVDTAGTEQTLAAAKYQTDLRSEPARIAPAYGEVWPSTRDQPNAVTVEFVAGLATPFTAAVDDTFASSGRTFAVGDKVRLLNSGGALPAGISALTDYYVITGSKLSLTSGGAAVDVTDTGTGTHFMITDPRGVFDTCRTAMKFIIGHLYENREAVNVGGSVTPMPFAVDALLVQGGWGGM